MNEPRFITSVYKTSHELSERAKDYWIRRTLREKGRAWVIAAMVDGSIGYHTPSGANNLIDWFITGHKVSYCERCDACFNCDLITMMYHDISVFDWMEDQDKANRIVEAMKTVMKWTDDQQLSLSFAYPTLNI